MPSGWNEVATRAFAKAGRPLSVTVMALDLFTRRRMIRYIEEFRSKQGQLPTLADLAQEGFDSERVKQALKEKVIEEFYVTLTNGTIVKGYKTT